MLFSLAVTPFRPMVSRLLLGLRRRLAYRRSGGCVSRRVESWVLLVGRSVFACAGGAGLGLYRHSSLHRYTDTLTRIRYEKGHVGASLHA